MRRALEINPRCFLAHRYQGLQMIARNEHDAALASFRRAQSIEPLAVNINANIAMAYYFSARYDEAIAQLELTLKMDPGFDVARTFLGRSFMSLGQFERAIEQFEGNAANPSRRASDLAAVYALSGRADEAKAVLDELLRVAESRYVSPVDIATIHAALENDEAALDCLEEAVELRAFDFVKVNPAYKRLHGHPRFLRLLERFGV
jgi:tetratricopeptide (TPR) repeat protein